MANDLRRRYVLISELKLFRNVGQFDTVTSAANIALAPLSLFYAENGRGKTTLAAILRSLSSGDPIAIAERRRLTAQHPPHVIVECVGGPPPAIFDNNAWNRTVPALIVFDDTFVDQNVCSGLAVDAEHRQNLHELILGAQGVALNDALLAAVARVEEQGRTLRAKADALPAEIRGNVAIDDFCALPARGDIDAAIADAERALAAAQDQDGVRRTAAFATISIPEIDLAQLIELLTRTLPDIEAAAMARVQAHFKKIGAAGEAWVEDGLQRLFSEGDVEHCPFCDQSVAGSEIIAHYRAFFSAEYADLKADLIAAKMAFLALHGGDAQAIFERAVRFLGERWQFWSRFAVLPAVQIDTGALSLTWNAVRDDISAAIDTKLNAPLESIELPANVRAAIATYGERQREIATLNDALQLSNAAIADVKERAASSNVVTLAADLAGLGATKSRHTPAIAAMCTEYTDAKAAKAQAEADRAAAREALDQHRAAAFPAYQGAINTYLQRFNAGFRLDRVVSTNTRGGSSCTYNVVINNHPVPIGGALYRQERLRSAMPSAPGTVTR